MHITIQEIIMVYIHVSQKSPTKSCSHVHVNPLSVLVQVAPLRHGKLEHASPAVKKQKHFIKN